MMNTTPERVPLAQDLEGLGDSLARAAAFVQRLQAGIASQFSNCPPIVDVRTVAKWLGMTDRGVRSLIARGEIPAARVGKRHVILVAEWLERLRASAAPQLAPVAIRAVRR